MGVRVNNLFNDRLNDSSNFEWLFDESTRVFLIYTRFTIKRILVSLHDVDKLIAVSVQGRGDDFEETGDVVGVLEGGLHDSVLVEVASAVFARQSRLCPIAESMRRIQKPTLNARNKIRLQSGCFCPVDSDEKEKDEQ